MRTSGRQRCLASSFASTDLDRISDLMGGAWGRGTRRKSFWGSGGRLLQAGSRSREGQLLGRGGRSSSTSRESGSRHKKFEGATE